MSDIFSSRTDLLKKIDDGLSRLQDISKQLKDHFVGLDPIIDKIIANIEVWYTMPELLTRPIIINLWGLTGVGKTDLVRRLVRGMGFSDSFVEVQLTNKGSAADMISTSIQSVLEYSNVEPCRPGVLLLDEMQRFRSVDENGNEIHDYKFQDVWALLSDGKFGGDASNKDRIMQFMFDAMYWEDEMAVEEENEEEPVENTDAMDLFGKGDVDDTSVSPRRRKKKKDRRFKQNYFEAKRLKKMLKLDEPIESIMTWDTQKQNKLLLEKMNSPEVYEGEDYSQLLIFVCGNLDEAYEMAHSCGDADVDADVFHEHSMRINVINIKDALKARFKPEQVARFGNTHIIYPSLSTTDYEEIINRKIACLIGSIKDKCGVDVAIGDSVKEFIYRNGVFPAQGTRPLFSTISSVIESTMPMFLYRAIGLSANRISIEYDKNCLVSDINGTRFSTKCEGDLDKIKMSKNRDRFVLTCVHEAGHAIVYAVLFGLVPTQIVAKTSSDDGGFIGIHNINNDEDSIRKQIAVLMAGFEAETFVFGKNKRTDGAKRDLSMASALAAEMVREFGMVDGYSSKIMLPYSTPESSTANNDYMKTNNIIENMVSDGKNKALMVLKDNVSLFKAICNALVEQGSMNNDEFVHTCERWGVKARVIAAKEIICSKYASAFDFFMRPSDDSTRRPTMVPGLFLSGDGEHEKSVR